jgi:hypothetical protein
MGDGAGVVVSAVVGRYVLSVSVHPGVDGEEGALVNGEGVVVRVLVGGVDRAGLEGGEGGIGLPGRAHQHPAQGLEEGGGRQIVRRPRGQAGIAPEYDGPEVISIATLDLISHPLRAAIPVAQGEKVDVCAVGGGAPGFPQMRVVEVLELAVKGPNTIGVPARVILRGGAQLEQVLTGGRPPGLERLRHGPHIGPTVVPVSLELPTRVACHDVGRGEKIAVQQVASGAEILVHSRVGGVAVERESGVEEGPDLVQHEQVAGVGVAPDFVAAVVSRAEHRLLDLVALGLGEARVAPIIGQREAEDGLRGEERVELMMPADVLGKGHRVLQVAIIPRDNVDEGGVRESAGITEAGILRG